MSALVLLLDTDHTTLGFTMTALGDQQNRAGSMKARFTVLRNHLSLFSAHGDLSTLTPDVQGGYHLRPFPPGLLHPAWISRQNVSLAVVLERRALNFKFSYTFPLSGTGRQRGRLIVERTKAWR